MSLLTRDCPGGLAIRRSANDRGTAVLGVGAPLRLATELPAAAANDSHGEELCVGWCAMGCMEVQT